MLDTLSVVSNDEQNLEVFFFTRGDIGSGANVNIPLHPAGNVVASAYTNNFAGATTTTLYGIDSATDGLVRQGGVNGTPFVMDGEITTLGWLSVDTSDAVGFDIVSSPFIATTDVAYASLTVDGLSRLYRIDLTFGFATLIGQIGTGVVLHGLAIAAPTSVTMYSVTPSNAVIGFNSATPGTIQSSVGIQGMRSGETVLGMDFRPSTGILYALGSSGRLYTIDLVSGQALQIGSPLAISLNGAFIDVDFDPVADQFRVVSNAGQNLRLHPDTGALIAVDTALNPPWNIMGVAYSNNLPAPRPRRCTGSATARS